MAGIAWISAFTTTYNHTHQSAHLLTSDNARINVAGDCLNRRLHIHCTACTTHVETTLYCSCGKLLLHDNMELLRLLYLLKADTVVLWLQHFTRYVAYVGYFSMKKLLFTLKVLLRCKYFLLLYLKLFVKYFSCTSTKEKFQALRPTCTFPRVVSITLTKATDGYCYTLRNCLKLNLF